MRASGILMPVFSLPGPYGIGTLGDEAFAFVDFLAAAKQTYWQILPIGPTGYGDSPYQSFSAFAGNPYFIDFRLLVADGLLTEAELPAPQPVGPVDYGALYQQRPMVLSHAEHRHSRMHRTKPPRPEAAPSAICAPAAARKHTAPTKARIPASGLRLRTASEWEGCVRPTSTAASTTIPSAR